MCILDKKMDIAWYKQKYVTKWAYVIYTMNTIHEYNIINNWYIISKS